MEIFSELIASELPKKEMSRSMSGLGKCLLEMNKLEELDDFLNQLEEDLKNSNEIKELIEAKNFFSSIQILGSQIIRIILTPFNFQKLLFL